MVSIEVPGLVFEKVLSKAHEAKVHDALVVYPEGPDTAIFNDSLTVQEIITWISPQFIFIAMRLFNFTLVTIGA